MSDSPGRRRNAPLPLRATIIVATSVTILTLIAQVPSLSLTGFEPRFNILVSPGRSTASEDSLETQELNAAQESLSHGDGAPLTPSSGSPGFPSEREYAAMAWDPAAGYVLLFGGSNITNPESASGIPNLADTWAFSNGAWTQLFPSASPLATDFAGMAYDANMSAVILFGGQNERSDGPVPVNYTWEFAAGQWVNVTTPAAPSPRLSPALAEDPARGGVVLFGGSQNYPYTEVSESDTWVFANGTWTNVTVKVGPSPPARVLAGLTYDPKESGDLLFGGWSDLGGTVALNDTWILGPIGWANVTARVAPPAAGGFGLSYLSESGTAILYGGSTPSLGHDYNETWSFSGGAWSRVSPGSVPPGSFAGTFTDDPIDGYGVLLLGAETPNAPVSEQTWVYVGGNWSLAGSNASLPPAGPATMVYFPPAQEEVMVASAGTSGGTSTWVFANGNWTKLTGPSAPVSLLVYDGAEGYVLGLETSFSTTSTWEFSNNTWSELDPATSPSPGESGGIAYDAHDGYVVFYDYTKGGGNPSTWEWSNGDWTNLNLTTQPDLDATLGRNTMTYDAADGYVLLVQRSNVTCGSAGNCLLTWSFSNGSWTDLTRDSTVTPPVLSDISIAYDAAIGEVVMFGGYAFTSESQATNETWAFAAGQWAELFPAVSPPPRASEALSYDAARGQLLTFGGYGTVPSAGGGSTVYPLADTWEFGNGTWVELVPSLAASLPQTDAEVPIVLTAVTPASFGFPMFTYTGLPSSCSSSDLASITCVPSESGRFLVSVVVSYAGGVQSTASTMFTVASLPQVSGFISSENPVAINGMTTLTATVSGGTGPFTYDYAGLPPGCKSSNQSSLACVPSMPGHYNVSVTFTDRFGKSASAMLLLTVGTVPVQVLPPGASSTYAFPVVVLVAAALVIGVAIASAGLVRRHRMRREGEQLVSDVRRELAEARNLRDKPP